MGQNDEYLNLADRLEREGTYVSGLFTKNDIIKTINSFKFKVKPKECYLELFAELAIRFISLDKGLTLTINEQSPDSSPIAISNSVGNCDRTIMFMENRTGIKRDQKPDKLKEEVVNSEFYESVIALSEGRLKIRSLDVCSFEVFGFLSTLQTLVYYSEYSSLEAIITLSSGVTPEWDEIGYSNE